MPGCLRSDKSEQQVLLHLLCFIRSSGCIFGFLYFSALLCIPLQHQLIGFPTSRLAMNPAIDIFLSAGSMLIYKLILIMLLKVCSFIN